MQCEIKIGDGSEYREGHAEWLDEWDIPFLSCATCNVAASVLWNDGEMMARIRAVDAGVDEGVPAEERKVQPDVTLWFNIHDFEGIAAAIASKRRELEMRSFCDQDNKANIIP